MARSDLDVHFLRVENLVLEIEEFVPEGTRGATDFRADLAGLVVVAMAVSYEACVKDVLINFASRKHPSFGQFANSEYQQLNSRVRMKDLYKYSNLFDQSIKAEFKEKFKSRKNKLLKRTGKNIEVSYDQILNWRHDFAHAGVRNTTIQEAMEVHRLAKRVLYCFDEAFEIN